jgi:tetratricopeptide (TPR) repeat protein
MARITMLLLAASIGSAAGPALAAVTVLGNSMARTCYEAAESKSLPRTAELEGCGQALDQEALSLEDKVATFVNRGILHARRGDMARAVADFDEATSRDPNQPEAYFNKAAVLLRNGGANQAVPLFSKAIEHRTRFMAGAYYGRGVAQEELGNVKAAYFDYQRASQADPKWAEPRAELARFTVRR